MVIPAIPIPLLQIAWWLASGLSLYEIASMITGIKVVSPDPLQDFLKAFFFPSGTQPPPGGNGNPPPTTCPSGQHLVNGVCVPITTPPTGCQTGYYMYNGVCVPDLYIPPPVVLPPVLPPGPVPPTPAADATTIAGALALANQQNSGEIVVLKDGTYDNNSPVDFVGKVGVVIMPQTQGGVIINGSPINLKSPGVIMQGFDLRYNIPSGDYMRMDGAGARLTRCKIHFGSSSDQKWIMSNAANQLIDHNEIYGKTSMDNMVTIVQPSTKILFNYIHDMTGSGTPMEAMRAGGSSESCTDYKFECAWNRFERISADTELCTWKCVNVNIHHNTMVDCNSSHTFRHGHDSRFENNICINSGGFRFYGYNHIVRHNEFIDCNRNQLRGPLIIGGGSAEQDPCGVSHAYYGRVKNCDISENLIVSNDKFSYINLYLGYGNSLPPLNNKIQRNIVVAAKGTLADVGAGASWPSNLVSGNILWPTGSAQVGSMPTSGYSKSDPKLVKMPDGTYSFSAGSPLQWTRTTKYLSPLMVGPLAP